MQSKTMTPEQGLQEAVNRAALEAMSVATDSAVSTAESGEKAEKPWNPRDGKRPPGASPLNGVRPPPTGRPPGVKNKLTNLRDAVLEAFDTVGGAEYLVRLAEGTQSDRAAFTSLVAKVLPTQINQNVEGGIKLELSWLGGRSIGTTAAQIPEARTQVLDLEQDSDGGYRIKDPAGSPAGVAEGVPPAGGDSTAAPGHAQSGPGGAQGGGT